MGPTWQLNVNNVQVLIDAADTFLEHLMETYPQLAVMGPTVIIGDFNAAPTMDHRGGGPQPEDSAVKIAMQHLDLLDLTASLRGEASHRPPQPGPTDSCIDLCYADPTHVEVTRMQYNDLHSKTTGHRPLEVKVKVLLVPQPPRTTWNRIHSSPSAPRTNTKNKGGLDTTARSSAPSATRQTTS